MRPRCSTAIRTSTILSTNRIPPSRVSQPLLRGRGRDISLRYIRIGKINEKISRLLFYQQLISTVYGIARLYYDLVSLNENVQVQRETLAAARKLYEDDKAQVEQGTLAPIGLTQAQSLVSFQRTGPDPGGRFGAAAGSDPEISARPNGHGGSGTLQICRSSPRIRSSFRSPTSCSR